MKIGILETGAPPKSLIGAYGDYPAMFRALLGEHHDFVTHDVRTGVLPPCPQDADGWIITGSAAGVYDPEPWIGGLLGWLRTARGRTRLVGICFGHQAMAQAFGGQVIKSPKGWGVGLHRYDVAGDPWWADGADGFAIAASHQDQVVELPPGAEVTARSNFAPYAGLAYGADAISFQGHPEFSPAYAAALIESRKEERLTADQADAALASLDQPNDRETVGGWIRSFLAR